MARRPGIWRRGDEPVTPQQAAREPGRVGRFVAWLGYGPEPEAQSTHPEREPKGAREPARPERTSAPSPGEDWAVPLTDETAAAPEATRAEEPSPAEAAPATEASAPSTRRTPSPSSSAAEAAERQAIEEIQALEEDLERAKEEAAAKQAELERELDATRRELDQARERAAAAEQRVSEVELESSQAIEHEPEPEVQPREPAGDDRTSLATASFEDLRSLGMSVTQSKRVLDYRERAGFESVDDLDRVPGFPKGFLARMKDSLTL
jgi:DNA uptake protein ComE-like DNA-binding protein